MQAQRQKCEVFSRIVGYLRPVNQWNDAKAQEFDMRKTYKPMMDLDGLEEAGVMLN